MRSSLPWCMLAVSTGALPRASADDALKHLALQRCFHWRGPRSPSMTCRSTSRPSCTKPQRRTIWPPPRCAADLAAAEARAASPAALLQSLLASGADVNAKDKSNGE